MTRLEQARRRSQLRKQNALQAFVAKKAEIDEMLARLTALSADHFGTDPNNLDWGDVGSLGHHAELLKRITDAVFLEGEFAV